jgi:hypothetical protein
VRFEQKHLRIKEGNQTPEQNRKSVDLFSYRTTSNWLMKKR